MIFLPLPVIDNLPTQKKKVKKNCLCLVRKTLKRKKKQIVVVKDKEYKLIIMLFFLAVLGLQHPSSRLYVTTVCLEDI